MTMDWQKVHLPLAQGQQQKADPRSLEAPSLAVCKNVEFDEVGGSQQRKPYGDLPGVPPSDIRRLATYGDELVAFTERSVYSYSQSTGEWIKRDEYLAPSVAESERLIRKVDQFECDRAELGGVIVYSWREGSSSSFLAAIDKETGAVVAGPTSQGGSSNGITKLTALKDRILVTRTQAANTEWTYKVLLPSNLDSTTQHEGLGGSYASAATVIGEVHDVCRVPGTDKAVVVYETTGGYSVRTITGGSSGAPTITAASAKARTMTDCIACAVAPDGTVLIARDDGSDLRGDILTSALVDDTVNVDIGNVSSNPDQITCAFRSEPESGGEYMGVVVWSEAESASALTTYIQSALIDSNGSAQGAGKIEFGNAGLASKAFSYDGEVMVWAVHADENISAGDLSSASGFTAALQNTLALLREDVTGGQSHGPDQLVAKAIPNYAGGYYSTGALPGVQEVDTNVFAHCATQRRVIPLGAEASTGYAERGLRDVCVTMDSDAARRTAEIGRSLYISGGQVSLFDGVRISEVGFHIYPWHIEASAAGSGGGMSAGDYFYKATFGWQNAKGETQRSTSALYGKITAVSNDEVTIRVGNTSFTRRIGVNGVAVEVWRTVVNPTTASPYYLVTSPDPSDIGLTDNEYVDHDPESLNLVSPNTAMVDAMADTTLTAKEANPENGGVLANIAPPAADVIAMAGDRLFIAGIPGAPHQIRYSQLRSDGEIAAFSDLLVVDLPSEGGKVTAIEFLNETMVVFKESAIYMLPGDGYDNVGGGQNYGPPRQIALDVGAENQESIGVTPQGVVFRSEKGWYILDRGWTVRYIGGAVSDYDDDNLVSVEVMADQHQVRVVSNERILVWDTLVSQWSEWDQPNIVGSCVWNGKHVIATSDDEILEQQVDFQSVDYLVDVETAWIKFDGLQGFQSVRKIQLLGEYRGAHRVRVRVAYDYDEVDGEPNWVDDKYWTPTPAVAGGPLQVRHSLKRRKCQAFKVRITDAHETVDGPPAGESMKLTGLSIEYGIKRGLRPLAAGQKQ